MFHVKHYFPIQKPLKRLSNTSSTSIEPTILPRETDADLKYSAAISILFLSNSIKLLLKELRQRFKLDTCLVLVGPASSCSLPMIFSTSVSNFLTRPLKPFLFYKKEAAHHFYVFIEVNLICNSITVLLLYILSSISFCRFFPGSLMRTIISDSLATFLLLLMPSRSIRFFAPLIPAVSYT